MDSGPVATFQVHDYLRPKVTISFNEAFMLSIDNLKWTCAALIKSYYTELF